MPSCHTEKATAMRDLISSYVKRQIMPMLNGRDLCTVPTRMSKGEVREDTVINIDNYDKFGFWFLFEGTIGVMWTSNSFG